MFKKVRYISFNFEFDKFGFAELKVPARRAVVVSSDTIMTHLHCSYLWDGEKGGAVAFWWIALPFFNLGLGQWITALPAAGQ